MDNLTGKNPTEWTVGDVATSTLMLDEIMGMKDVDTETKKAMLANLQDARQEVATHGGQISQAFAIQDGTMEAGESPATALDSFRDRLDKLKPEESTWKQTKNGPDYETWKSNIRDNVDSIAIEVASVEDGDTAAMKNVIRDIAKYRKTTAWFGTSDRLSAQASAILNKLDFDTLKTIANTQIASMADDFRARSKKDVLSGLRKQSMLSSLKTWGRNLGGNGSTGILDAMSDSGAGQMADYLLSKVTGKRTIGADIQRAKTYAGAAWDATKFATLCVELDIPIETDAASSLSAALGEGKGGKYIGKTFRPDGNVAMRAMYAYQKYMSYALEVSDKLFEGGTSSAITESLEALKNSNLTGEEIDRLSEYTANRRTFKDATWTDENGTHGSFLSRKTTNLVKATGAVGDAIIPFASVPMNVTQTGIDYTAGIAKGFGEIASLIRDAKAGKEIDVARQRQAASDFGRGVTGVGMIAAFAGLSAAGAIKVSNDEDWDKRYLEQSQGLSGAQINWDAAKRAFHGESAEWQEGDSITSLDFLEPFNTQMYLGYELAQSDSIQDMAKQYPGSAASSVFNSLMDSPMMTGLADLGDLISSVTGDSSVENITNEVASYGGDVASSFIPQFVRQTAQYTDGYYRDTTGQTPTETAVNKILAAIPGLSESLPAKYNGLGQIQERGDALNTYLDATDTHSYSEDEVVSYLNDLSEATGDKSIYPDASVPKTIKVDGETVAITGADRETYGKTYGEAVNALYSELMNNDAFSALPKELQTAGLEKAKSYATAMAKAAVSDYDGAPEGSTGELASQIVQSTVESQFNNAFSDLTESWSGGTTDSEAKDELEQAYELYDALPQEQKTVFREDASGRLGYYLEARDAGISTETFAKLYQSYRDIDNRETLSESEKAEEWAYQLEKAAETRKITEAQKDTLKDSMVYYQMFPAEAAKFDQMTEAGVSSDSAKLIGSLLDNVQGTGSVDEETGVAAVKDIDNYEAIANSGLSDSEIDAVMKVYLPNSGTYELKYDAIRDMGISPQGYAATYRIYLDASGSGSGKKSRTISQYMETFGCSRDVATEIYNIYAGAYKPWEQ